MSPPETFPAIDACIDLYVTVHDRYGMDAFDPDDLSRRSCTRDDGTNLPADTRSLTRRLDLLVAYGLLERRDDGRYRVRCAPEEGLDRWRIDATNRIEALYRRVHRAMGTSGDDPDDGGGRAQLRHDGAVFAGIRVSKPGDLDSAPSTVRAVLDEHPECAGIVFRSPGELAAEVQRFADELCDPSAAMVKGRTFEKETTELVGDHKDDLEFRLFLRETY